MKTLSANQLKQIIKEETAKYVALKNKQTPSTFTEFAERVSFAMKKVGLPAALVSEIANCDDGGASNALIKAWGNIQHELSGNYGTGVVRADVVKEGFWNYFSYEINDALVDCINEWQNPMNYDIDRKFQKLSEKSSVLAEQVVQHLTVL